MDSQQYAGGFFILLNVGWGPKFRPAAISDSLLLTRMKIQIMRTRPKKIPAKPATESRRKLRMPARRLPGPFKQNRIIPGTRKSLKGDPLNMSRGIE